MTAMLHPALVNHIQAMHDDLGDMMDNPEDYDPSEPLELSLLLLDIYESLLQQYGIIYFEREQVH